MSAATAGAGVGPGANVYAELGSTWFLVARRPTEAAHVLSKLLAAVGPEGGFDAEEVAKAQAAGFLPIGLGPRILRADTAAIAIVTLLQYLWGDLGERHNQKEGLSP